MWTKFKFCGTHFAAVCDIFLEGRKCDFVNWKWWRGVNSFSKFPFIQQFTHLSLWKMIWWVPWNFSLNFIFIVEFQENTSILGDTLIQISLSYPSLNSTATINKRNLKKKYLLNITWQKTRFAIFCLLLSLWKESLPSQPEKKSSVQVERSYKWNEQHCSPKIYISAFYWNPLFAFKLFFYKSIKLLIFISLSVDSLCAIKH